MNYEQLLYVSELANHHTLQETADLLHISKSGLSQSISQLENELGVKLFTRSHQGTVLTAQGRQMLPYIKSLLTANLRLVHQANRLGSKHDTQPIRLAYANTFLKPMLTEFLKLYQPTRFLTIKRLDSTAIIKAVRQHTIDAGFVAIDIHHESELRGLQFAKVHDGHISLIVSPANPLLNRQAISVTDLRRQKFALFTDPYNDQLFDHLQYLCGPLETVIRVDDAWAMATVITQLNAVCLGRDWQAQNSTEQELASLPKIDLSAIINDRFTLGWVTNPNYRLDPFAAKLIAGISQQLKDEEQ